MKIILRFSLQCKDLKISILFCFDETRYCNTTELPILKADLKICSKIKNFKNFFVSPNIYFFYAVQVTVTLLPENSTQSAPARTSLLPRENRDILTRFFGHTEHFRHCREKAVLAAGNTLPTGRAGAPPARRSAGRPALPRQAGGRLTLGCRFYTPYLWLYK